MKPTTAQSPTAQASAVDELESAESNLLATGRSIFGVSGEFEYGRLREALRASGLSVRPAIGIAAGATAAVLPLVAVWVLQAEVNRSLGGYGSQLALLVTASFAAGSVAGPLVVARTHHRARLAAVLGIAGGASVTFAAFGAFYGLLFWLTLAAIAGGIAHAVLLPLLYDLYPPEVRARVVGLYVGGVVATLAATTGALAIVMTVGLSWRVVLLALGAVSGLGSAVMLAAADPRIGAWDQRLLAHEAHEVEG